MLITSCKLPPSAGVEKKNDGPKAHNDQPTIHKLTFWERCISEQTPDASLFSGCKEDSYKARNAGQRQRRALRPARRRGDGSASLALAWSPLLLFQTYFKLTSTSRPAVNSWLCKLSLSSNRVQRGSEPRDALDDTDINPDEAKATG